MIVAVADTHAIIWYLYADVRLSATAKNTIDAAINTGDMILVSAITLVEMVYLIEKGRIAAEALTRVANILGDPEIPIDEHPVDLVIARTLSQIERTEIPDMPDRIIAATALSLSVPVISRDGKIRTSTLQTIW
jgi:PIN domain nuclease of toxin-antitoxin system